MNITTFFKRLLLLCVALVTSVQAGANTQQKDMVSLSVNNSDLRTVMGMLSREKQVNIILSNGVEGKVTADLYNLDIDRAIKYIANAAGFAADFRDGSYFITKLDEVTHSASMGLTDLRVFKIQYNDPAAVKEILTPHLSRYGNITVLKNRNVLVVKDLSDKLEQLQVIVDKIDKEPKQVLIEAKILEITLRDNESFGFDWKRLFTSKEGEGSFGTRGLSTPTSPGLFFQFLNPDIELFLDALKTRGQLRTLSTPTLLALEDQEASTVIGDLIGYKVTTTINQVTTESIEFLESGVILKVKPSVDNSGKILLEIHPEVSTGTVTDDGIPLQKTTNVTTQMLIPNGQTAFIGGLLKRSSEDTREGIPGLGDLPGVGGLFSNKSSNVVHTETVVLTTPRIVESPTSHIDQRQKRKVDEVDNALNNRSATIGREMN